MFAIRKFKTIGILFFFGFGFTVAQNDPTIKIDPKVLSEFDLMSEIANKDIRSAIGQGIIPADIAITSFAVYGFSEPEKKYFQEVMNRIFFSDVSFKLVSVQESQTIKVEEVDDKLIIKKGASKNSDLKKYADSVGSKHYGEVYIYAMTTRTYMKVLVHDADTGDVVWSGNWSVKRKDRFTAEIGYSFGYGFPTSHIYHLLHSFFGARVVGLGEFGLSLDLGIYQPLGLATSQQEGSNSGDLGASMLFAPKVSLNIMELIRYGYFGVDIYGILKPGLRTDLLVITSGSESQLMRPKFSFSGNVGLGFGFKKINMDLLFDVNPQGGLIASLSIYYKF